MEGPPFRFKIVHKKWNRFLLYVEESSHSTKTMDWTEIEKLLSTSENSLASHVEMGLDDKLRRCLIRKVSHIREWDSVRECAMIINYFVDKVARNSYEGNEADREKDHKALDKLISKSIKVILSVVLGYHRRKINAIDGAVVSALHGMFERGSPGVIRRVATKSFCRFVVDVMSSKCVTAVRNLMLPIVCLWEKSPKVAFDRLTNPFVIFTLRSFLDVPLHRFELSESIRERLVSVYRANRLEVVFERNFPRWDHLSTICKKMAKECDRSTLSEVAALVRRREVSLVEFLEGDLPTVLSGILLEDADERNVKMFLDSFVVTDGGDRGSSSFGSLVELLTCSATVMNDIVLGHWSFKGKRHSCRECSLGRCAVENASRCMHLYTDLLKVLYSLNETWFQWFDEPKSPPLIDRRAFEIWNIDFGTEERLLNPTPLRWYTNMATRCPLAFSYKTRKTLFDISNRNRFRTQWTYFLPRNKLLEGMRTIFLVASQPFRPWFYTYEGDIARGLGPTKEIYSALSLEFQRHDLNMWSGEPVVFGFESSSDSKAEAKLCTYSPRGLYPRLDVGKVAAVQKEFNLLGKVMGKALIDGHVLDIPVNPEFLRLALFPDPDGMDKRGHYRLSEVLPVSSRFIDQLVSIKKMKDAIASDERLTEEEKRRTIGGLTFDDGSSFGDLCINFTVPGCPEVVLKEGGESIALGPWNVDEYLDRLSSLVMFKDDPTTLASFAGGFFKFATTSQVGLFLPDELPRLLCGDPHEAWSRDHVTSCCSFSERVLESRVFEHLVEVLCGLDGGERKSFLKFVTASARLPCGGLRSLKPPLRVDLMRCDRDETDSRLPNALTCLNLLVVPDYSSSRVTRERLLYAISECVDSFQFV